MEEIAKPPPNFPHLNGSASTPSVEVRDASVKSEGQMTSEVEVKAPESDAAAHLSPSRVQIKIEEPQGTSAATEPASTMPSGDSAGVADTPTRGKRSREASGMAVDEVEDAMEQAKKQKVEAAE